MPAIPPKRASASTSPGVARRGLPGNTYAKTLEASSDVTFCGWTVKRGEGLLGLFSARRYFALTAGRELYWYEGSESAELKLAGRADMTQLTALKRERPDSETDFSFRLVTKAASLRLDPGSLEAWLQWQENLLQAAGPF